MFKIREKTAAWATVSVIGLFALSYFVVTRFPEREPRTTSVKIIEITVTPYISRAGIGRSPRVWMRGVSPGGRFGEEVIPLSHMHCHIGQVIPAEEVGAFLRFDPRDCGDYGTFRTFK
jgi:hypothetical protein